MPILGTTLKTEKEAKRAAAKLAKAIKEDVYYFRVPEGTQAYMIGYRFATCRASERADYEKDGAEMIAFAGFVP